MICKHCKADIPGGFLFCPHCGQRAEAEPVSAPASPTGFHSAFHPAGSLEDNDFGVAAPPVERPAVTAYERPVAPAFERPAAPVYEPPVTPTPTYERPVTPVYEKPAAPVYERPVTPAYEKPVYEQPAAPVYEQPAAAKYCPRCGNTLHPDAVFCNRCGASLTATAPKAPAATPPRTRKPTPVKAGFPVVPVIAAVLVVVLLIGILTSGFGFFGPATQIALATRKTLTARNFTMEFEMSMDDYNEASGTVQIALDLKKRDLTLYAELDVDGDSEVYAIYDGYLLQTYGSRVYKTDISDDMDAIFDAIEEGAEDVSSLEELIDSIGGRGTYEEMEEYVDLDKVDKCFGSYVRSLNSKRWLKEYAGYSSKREDGAKLHCFEPKLHEFVEGSLPSFKKLFNDEDDYEDIMDSLGELKAVSNLMDMSVAFGLKSGKLVRLDCEISIDDYMADFEELIIEAEFKDIGKTKIDTDELEDLLDSAY